MKTRFWNEQGIINTEIDMAPVQDIIHTLFEAWTENGFHERDFVEAVIHAAQLELFDYYVQKDLESLEKPSSLKWAGSIEDYDPESETREASEGWEEELPIFTIEEFRENIINGLFNDEDGYAIVCGDGVSDGTKLTCDQILEGCHSQDVKFISWHNK